MNKSPNNGFITPTKKQQSQYNGKCVCQICTCGKDRCPPQQIHVDPQHYNTINKQSYQKWEIKKTPKCIPYESRINYGQQQLQSSYQRDYTPQKPVERQSRLIQDPLLTQHRSFVGSSEYNQRYKPYQTITLANKPKYFYQENNNKFLGHTTYGDSFIKQPQLTQSQIKPNERSYTPTNIQFNSASKYQEDYQPQKINPATPIKHSNLSPFGGNTIEKTSSYQKDYPIYNSDTYKKQECPVRKLPFPDRNKSPNKHLIFSSIKGDWE